jgi:AraC-like DNA-binding protein
MLVLLLLHAPAAKLLGNTLGANARIIVSTTVACFVSALDRERVDVAVVDPSVDVVCSTARLGAHPLVRSLGRAAAPPFVLYLSDGRGPLALRSALVRLQPAMVAARGIDDQPGQFRSIIDRALASRVPDDLLTLLAEPLSGLRASLADALADAIRCPLDCNSVSDLESAAGISSRVLSREVKEAGLASARNWLAAGRVLRAHWELRDPGVRIRHLVALMGYSSEEPLANDVSSVTEGTPSELRRMSAAELIAVVAGRLAPNARIASIGDRWNSRPIGVAGLSSPADLRIATAG